MMIEEFIWPEMEKPMRKSKLPKTDSIQELAESWDTHDLTDFEDELEEVAEPVFMRRTPIEISLAPGEAKAVQQMAKAKGVSREELIRAWVLEQLAGWSNGRKTKRTT
jgi:predicted DNA binding CopG/RHH family protein